MPSLSSAIATKSPPLPPQPGAEFYQWSTEAVPDAALDRASESRNACARDSLPPLLPTTLPQTSHNDPVLPRCAVEVGLLPRLDVPRLATFFNCGVRRSHALLPVEVAP